MFKKRVASNLIEATVAEDGRVMTKMNMFSYDLSVNPDENIKEIGRLMGLKGDDVAEIVAGREYYDIFFVLKNSAILRNLCVSSRSDDANFDFETRVFCPHDNLDEDVACGSSNLTISRYWSDKTGKNNFKILFPYRMAEDGAAGGVQFIEIENEKIFIGGYCN
jgi:predicted PhzF superfamily epimerase YddE/YHI9